MSESRRRRRPAEEQNAAIPEYTAAQRTSQTQQYDQGHYAEQPSYRPPQRETQYAYQTPPVSQQPTVIVNQVQSNNTGIGYGTESHFDGGLLSLIGWSLLAALITIITLGFAYPFAACMLYSWEARHTVINGRRLYFDGNGLQLWGKWIIWLLLTVITLGIYSFWLVIKLKQWRIYHTHFAN